MTGDISDDVDDDGDEYDVEDGMEDKYTAFCSITAPRNSVAVVVVILLPPAVVVVMVLKPPFECRKSFSMGSNRPSNRQTTETVKTCILV